MLKGKYISFCTSLSNTSFLEAKILFSVLFTEEELHSKAELNSLLDYYSGDR